MRNGVRPAVSVVVPAFNEAEAVADQVRAIQRVLGERDAAHEILVVDDGSDDRTAQEASEAGARVLRHAENRGYGAALKTGILAATHDSVVIIDADGTYPADRIPALVDGLAQADMVVGARTGARVRVPWARRPAKWILGWIAGRVAGRRIPDLNSGLRAFRRECLVQYFPLLSDRFSFTTTATLALLADGYRIAYESIDYHDRIGQSKIRPRHFMDFIILVLRMAMLHQPLRVLVPLAVTCLGAGSIKTAFDVVAVFQRAEGVGWSLLYEPVLSTSAVLLLLVGLQVLLVGMVADALLRRIGQQRAPLVPSRAVVEVTPEERPARVADEVGAPRR